MHCFGVSKFFDPLSLSKKYHLEVFHKLKNFHQQTSQLTAAPQPPPKNALTLN
jgi:hypothetical protein